MAEISPNIPHQASVGERWAAERSKNVEGNIGGIAEAVKNFGVDAAKAYKLAGTMLDSGSLSKQLLTGGTVVGTGYVLERVSEALLDSVGWSLAEKLGYDSGYEKISRKYNMGSSPKDGSYNRFEYVKFKKDGSWDPAVGNKLPKFKDVISSMLDKQGVSKNFHRTAQEILTDVVVAGEYSAANRFLGFFMPQLQTSHIGASVLIDAVGGVVNAQGEKHGVIPKGWEPKDIMPKKSSKKQKAGMFIARVFDVVNPVTLLGAELVKEGIDRYIDAFKSVREERKLEQQGLSKHQVYSGEGRPQGKYWKQKSHNYRGGGGGYRGGRHG